MRPLVVDLDGSLLRSDSLQEAVAAGLRHPRRLAAASVALAREGKASMKRVLAAGGVDLVSAPLNSAVRDLIEERVTAGGRVILATGADQAVAEHIAERVPGLHEVMASDGTVNLTGQAKVARLVDRFGDGGFDYVGNSPADIPVWRHAHDKFLATLRPVGVPSWSRELSFLGVLRDPSPPRWRVWTKALRVHQSAKNVLILLPLIAAHEFTNPQLIALAIGAFVSFSLMASSVYLLNDTLDLAADRSHHSKYLRPLAAGWIPPITALSVGCLLALASLVFAAFLGVGFLVVLIVYAITTTSYSFWLKRVAVVDVVVLALLYMIRIVAGAVVTGIALSFWFTAVTLFLFLSLALVKRYAEAHESRERQRAMAGRGYSGDDVHAILALGSAAGVGAVVLAATYIQSDAVAQMYAAPSALWPIIPLAFYWIANLWLKAGRGEMHDDPLVFALKDRSSLLAGGLILLVFVAASLPMMGELLRWDILR
jgi:4-hydroxybenzoate polyprenyltransferase